LETSAHASTVDLSLTDLSSKRRHWLHLHIPAMVHGKIKVGCLIDWLESTPVTLY
jgi:hypothetical protein